MTYFLVKSYCNNSNPLGLFGSKAPDLPLYYFCEGYEDLKKTIRCLTPGGYPSRKAEWFYKNLPPEGHITILNSLNNSTLLEIKQTPEKLPVEGSNKLPDIFGHAHELKRVSAAIAFIYFEG